MTRKKRHTNTNKGRGVVLFLCGIGDIEREHARRKTPASALTFND